MDPSPVGATSHAPRLGHPRSKSNDLNRRYVGLNRHGVGGVVASATSSHLIAARALGCGAAPESERESDIVRRIRWRTSPLTMDGFMSLRAVMVSNQGRARGEPSCAWRRGTATYPLSVEADRGCGSRGHDLTGPTSVHLGGAPGRPGETGTHGAQFSGDARRGDVRGGARVAIRRAARVPPLRKPAQPPCSCAQRCAS